MPVVVKGFNQGRTFGTEFELSIRYSGDPEIHPDCAHYQRKKYRLYQWLKRNGVLEKRVGQGVWWTNDEIRAYGGRYGD